MRFVIASCLAFFVSCQDYTMNGIEKRQPQMLVHPEEIDFGRLDAGAESGHESFVIINTGDEDLKIFAPDLVSGNVRFEIDEYDQEEITIEGGDLLEVNVYYTPSTYETNGAYVYVEGNDDENQSVNVLLTGGGDAPVMSVTRLVSQLGSDPLKTYADLNNPRMPSPTTLDVFHARSWLNEFAPANMSVRERAQDASDEANTRQGRAWH